MGVIRQIRIARAQLEISPAKTVAAIITSKDAQALGTLSAHSGYIELLAKTGRLEIAPGLPRPKRAVSAISGPFNIYLPMEGSIDLEKESARLLKEVEKLSKDLELCAGRLKDETFMTHAPGPEVEKIKTRETDTAEKLCRLKTILEELR